METNKTNKYLDKTTKPATRTPDGEAYLSTQVTNTRGQVYTFYENASPLITAAAMARLSRSSSDLREILLDEFALTGDEDADSLIQRVVSEYGDDSVQQLAGQSVVVEGASNLLTKKLEWGRFAAYLEQSTRYIFFDTLDSEGKYKYFVPEHFDDETQLKYTQTLDKIFVNYSNMVRGIAQFVRSKSEEPDTPAGRTAWMQATRAQACDAVRTVLPVATKSTVGIFGSTQAIEGLVIRLMSERLVEAREIGSLILQEVRKVMPAFYRRIDVPDRGIMSAAYLALKQGEIEKLASELTNAEDIPFENVELLDYWPENELEIVADMLFSESQLSTNGIKKAIEKLSPDKHLEIFNAYMGNRFNRRHRPGRALEFLHYKFEITADYGTFRDLQRHRVVDGFEWQRLTTNYGYDIPKLVEEAGMVDSFMECFELSKELVGYLQTKGLNEESQYATLLGHKMRYRFMINAREAFHLIELRTQPQGHPGYRKISQNMFNLIAEKHPNIAEAMKFVNMDEGPALTRLASEEETQKKLERLNQTRVGNV